MTQLHNTRFYNHNLLNEQKKFLGKNELTCNGLILKRFRKTLIFKLLPTSLFVIFWDTTIY